jgi:hypothetical protein
MINRDRLLKLKIGDTLNLKRDPQPYDDLIVAIFNGDVRLESLLILL